ncbi:MAG: NADP-dependent isocitrate dehydrogenase [Pseudomonadales bacterium]|nr:NADP-dependent isocitrate dehydrogenase [Pseudomonadales bacterium]
MNNKSKKRSAKIIYTETDEAPRLATFSLLPIIQAFTASAGVKVETRDISLSGRIIAAFPERLSPEQRLNDDLAELGEMTQSQDANIIKLPNISASNPQMQAAIAELQSKGYDLPDYPEEPRTTEEQDYRQRYDRIKGSAVNPVLREGNSDRRAADVVKEYARMHPHSMGAWSKESRSHVSSMKHGDFFENEKSRVMHDSDTLSIKFTSKNGESKELVSNLQVSAGEIVDATFMSKEALCEFFEEALANVEEGVLFSLHLKATMMKVSDPIIFGHCVDAYYNSALQKHKDLFTRLGVDTKNGIGDVYEKISSLPAIDRDKVRADLDACLSSGPQLAMVNSDLGITNLHVPSDIIIDASMPAAIRESGKMWGPDGELHDMKAVIPDRSYAEVYGETIDHCKKYGAFDPREMGSVPNVGLMAQKAQEYGSHDTTYEIPEEGIIRVVDSSGDVIHEHHVRQGDIWRMCRVKDGPVRDWVNLAIKRSRATSWPMVFWLDSKRAHDAQLIKKVEEYLADGDLKDLEYQIMKPGEATRFSLERARKGLNTISVTGNVLRDYLTDLFPILELGTSAKMLSIVPLINGGGLFETGAGGSAPKHVQQFEKEGHLRWDSLGEFLALGASLGHLSESFKNDQAQMLADSLNQAIGRFLEENKSPSRKVNEPDNRNSHFYLAMYWADALAAQDDDADLKEKFRNFAAALRENEDRINSELLESQDKAQDVGGYFRPDEIMAEKSMRPSSTLNDVLGLILS